MPAGIALGEHAEIERAKRKPTESLDAYDFGLLPRSPAPRAPRYSVLPVTAIQAHLVLGNDHALFLRRRTFLASSEKPVTLAHPPAVLRYVGTFTFVLALGSGALLAPSILCLVLGFIFLAGAWYGPDRTT